jgi:nitrogenase molybdenum-iron protein alpha chain
MPIGIENTNLWLREVAAFFKHEEAVEKIIIRENQELDEALAPIRKNLRGKKALISAGEVRTIATAGLLQDLGMEIVAVRPYHFDRFGNEELGKLVGKQGDLPVNVATVQPFESVNIIEKTRPDIYLGHVADNVWAAKSGIPVMPIYGGAFTYAGYAGAFDIARRINRILQNPSFNKNLRHNVRQPYFADWYNAEPFKYITARGENDE